MGTIVHVVNSDFGYGHNLAIHSLKIAAELEDPRELTVFCRAAARSMSARYDLRPIGLGRTAGHLLKGVNRYALRRFPYRQIEQRFFEASLGRALAKLAEQPVSVVHTWSSIPRLLVPLKARQPSVLLVQDHTMGVDPSDRSWIQEDLEVYDYLFSPSAFVSETLAAAGVPADRIVRIPYGVDPDEFAPRPIASPGSTFRVAFSGLVGTRKGILTLLDAWESLALPDAELNLYGAIDPPVAKRVRDTSRCHVVARGFVDLRAELPRNDLFVFPSFWEGSAKAVYEALACGLPVITTPNAGSVVEDGIQGFIVPPGNASALAAKIRYFYDRRDELARFGAEARKQGQAYSWSRYAKTVIDCYRTLVPRRPA